MVYHSPLYDEQSDLPSDIRLRLTLIQSKWLLRTSSDENSLSAASFLIIIISGSVGIDSTMDNSHRCHKAIFPATFRALKAVITLSKMLPLISDMLSSVVHVECQILLPRLCIQLCKCEWLAMMGPMYFRQVSLDRRSCSFAAAAFAEALHVLKRQTSLTYNDVLQYTQDTSNLLVLCRILLLSDTKRQLKLGRLISLMTPMMRSTCLQDLDTFIYNDEDSCTIYSDLQTYPMHPHEDGRELSFKPVAELPLVVADFSKHVEMHGHDCGCTWSTCVEEANVAILETRIGKWWRNSWPFVNPPETPLQDGTAMV
ncbi:hypothetical protein CPB85DRAFT_1012401 [Mucidula mucida]|nr:hypothetical protein CPB85DRAFT_1012401 [Mucidula mucida]